MDEIIYVLNNEAMPGICKIGKTSDLELRMKSLYQGVSGVPLPFECVYAAKVKNMNGIERAIHTAFDDYRLNPNREFFSIAPEKITALIRGFGSEVEDITPKKEFVGTKEEQKAIDNARKKRERFNFEMVKIPLESELYFSRDKSLKATVMDNKHIRFNNEIMSLSKSARQILGVDYGVAGTDYWMYEGETLDERRRKIQSGE
jgi:hypothetical protein